MPPPGEPNFHGKAAARGARNWNFCPANLFMRNLSQTPPEGAEQAMIVLGFL